MHCLASGVVAWPVKLPAGSATTSGQRISPSCHSSAELHDALCHTQPLEAEHGSLHPAGKAKAASKFPVRNYPQLERENGDDASALGPPKKEFIALYNSVQMCTSLFFQFIPSSVGP